MVSVLCCVLPLNGGGVCCCRSISVVWCRPCSAYPGAVLTGTAVVSCAVSLLGVWCVWVSVSVVFVWWGILRASPPLTVVVGGGIVGGGVPLCGGVAW